MTKVNKLLFLVNCYKANDVTHRAILRVSYGTTQYLNNGIVLIFVMDVECAISLTKSAYLIINSHIRYL